MRRPPRPRCPRHRRSQRSQPIQSIRRAHGRRPRLGIARAIGIGRAAESRLRPSTRTEAPRSTKRPSLPPSTRRYAQATRRAHSSSRAPTNGGSRTGCSRKNERALASSPDACRDPARPRGPTASSPGTRRRRCETASSPLAALRKGNEAVSCVARASVVHLALPRRLDVDAVVQPRRSDHRRRHPRRRGRGAGGRPKRSRCRHRRTRRRFVRAPTLPRLLRAMHRLGYRVPDDRAARKLSRVRRAMLHRSVPFGRASRHVELPRYAAGRHVRPDGLRHRLRLCSRRLRRRGRALRLLRTFLRKREIGEFATLFLRPRRPWSALLPAVIAFRHTT